MTCCQAGELLQRKDLANTLEAIATNGSDAFYSGHIAESIVSAISQNFTGGILTLEDLKKYQATVDPPVQVDFNGKAFYMYVCMISLSFSLSLSLSLLSSTSFSSSTTLSHPPQVTLVSYIILTPPPPSHIHYSLHHFRLHHSLNPCSIWRSTSSLPAQRDGRVSPLSLL